MSNQPAYPATSLRRIAKVAAILAGAVILSLVGWKWYRLHAFHSQYDRGWAMIRSLEGRRPPVVSQDEWDFAFPWATNVYCETFSSPFDADVEAMKRFNDALELKVKGEPTFDVFDWVWDELARTTPAGKRYNERFRQHYSDDLELLRKRAARPQSASRRNEGR